MKPQDQPLQYCLQQIDLWTALAKTKAGMASPDQAPDPTDDPPDDLGDLAGDDEIFERPQPEIILPHEQEAAAFYGAPDRTGGYLKWFNFPTDGIVLYSRDGPKLSDHTGDEFDDHKIHANLVPAIESAFTILLEKLGPDRFVAEGWHVYAGCFNYRRKKAGSSLSLHSWAAAIDLTAWGTGLITSTCGFSEQGIDIMEAHGFLWGPRAWGQPGEYENLKYPGKFFDAMHFQAAIPYLNPNSFYARNGLPKHISEWNKC